MTADRRGWRMALVPEALINPPENAKAMLPDVLTLLDAGGYGVMQLPPAGDHGLLLAVIADQVAEYAHHGYAVVAVGLHGEEGGGLHWRRLAPLLRKRGVTPPPRFTLRSTADTAAETQRLDTFLSGYDIPLEQQRHWRV